MWRIPLSAETLLVLLRGSDTVPTRGKNVLDNAVGAAIRSQRKLQMSLGGLVIVEDCDQGRWCEAIAAPQL